MSAETDRVPAEPDVTAYLIEFRRTLTRRIGVFGDAPADSLAEAKALLAAGIVVTRDLYDEDSYVVAEDCVIATDKGAPVAVDPHAQPVLFDDGSIGTLQPTAAPYVWRWRGDEWATNGVAIVTHDGPRIESDEVWQRRPDAPGLARLGVMIDCATVPLEPWTMAAGRWTGPWRLRQECAVGGDREIVVDSRYLMGGRHLRWTCSPTPGEPVCGWDGDRLMIVVMPMVADRIQRGGPT